MNFSRISTEFELEYLLILAVSLNRAVNLLIIGTYTNYFIPIISNVGSEKEF